MSENMIEDDVSPESLNKKYFISLGNGTGSTTWLNAWALIFLLFSIFGVLAGGEIHSWYNNVLSGSLVWLLKFFVVYAVVLNIFLFIKPLRRGHKHQVAASMVLLFTVLAGFIALQSFLFLTINAETLGLRKYRANFSSIRSMIYLLLIGIILLALTGYTVLWMRKNLRKGFPEQENTVTYLWDNTTYLSFFRKPSANLSLILLGIIFTIPALTVGSIVAFGFLCGIATAIALPKFMIETGYLTYLRSVDKIYWEKEVEQKPTSSKKKASKKSKKK